MADVTFVDKYIVDGKSSLISLSKFYDTILITNRDNPDHIFRVPLHDTFLKYREHFQDMIVLYQLPANHFYQPKRLSEELYGTTEMWLSILRLNGMRNISEFNQPMVMIYDPERIREFINIFFKREGKIS